MDVIESSAMTEASGLTGEQGDLDRASADRASPKSGASDGRATSPTSRDAAVRWAQQLREITVKAPLQSLVVAFLVGIWFARRR